MIRETSEEKFLKILRDGEPFALDDQNHIAKFNLSTKEINTILEKICKKSSLLAEDVSDLWNPKNYYQFIITKWYVANIFEFKHSFP